MRRRRIQAALATLAFLSAVALYTLGLTGFFSPWLLSLVGSLALLVVGFFLVDDDSRTDSQ